MDLPEKTISEIDSDLLAYEDYLLEISNEVVKTKVSKYPIFVLHQLPNLELGKLVIDKDRSKTKWSVNISIIEDFVNKGIINPDKAENFTSIYKDPDKFICIFLVAEDTGNFIFRPYTITKPKNEANENKTL